MLVALVFSHEITPSLGLSLVRSMFFSLIYFFSNLDITMGFRVLIPLDILLSLLPKQLSLLKMELITRLVFKPYIDCL